MTTVIYHSADYDGIFCREIARKFIPEANLIGWNFGDPKVSMPTEGDVYVLDLSPECLDFPLSTGLGKERLRWIDHHKTSIEKFPSDIPGYRIDGVAACRLAWQWFYNNPSIEGEDHGYNLPEKNDFVKRLVEEPLAVRLVGEYDVWDHRGDGDMELQFGLDMRDRPTSPLGLNWSKLLSMDEQSVEYVKETIAFGELGMGLYAKRDSDIMRERSFLMEWEGLKFLCLNTPRCNSNTFAARDIPETGHDALLAFFWNGRVWTVSMYHAQHRKDLDLSQIAVKYGGGGHRGACGFTTEILPFTFLKVN